MLLIQLPLLSTPFKLLQISVFFFNLKCLLIAVCGGFVVLVYVIYVIQTKWVAPPRLFNRRVCVAYALNGWLWLCYLYFQQQNYYHINIYTTKITIVWLNLYTQALFINISLYFDLDSDNW